MGSFRSNSFANVRIFSEIPTIYKHFLFVFFLYFHGIKKCVRKHLKSVKKPANSIKFKTKCDFSYTKNSDMSKKCLIL